MSYILAFIFFYLLYKFIVKIAWPIFKVSRTVRKTMKGMQQPHQSNFQSTNSTTSKNQGFQAKAQKVKPSTSEKAGDYIDFEEIK